jgi:hypothetical protein
MVGRARFVLNVFASRRDAYCCLLSPLPLEEAVFYAVLWLIGLKHGALVGFAAGLISFIPYLGSLLGLTVRRAAQSRNSGQIGRPSLLYQSYSSSGNRLLTMFRRSFAKDLD